MDQAQGPAMTPASDEDVAYMKMQLDRGALAFGRLDVVKLLARLERAELRIFQLENEMDFIHGED